MFSLINVTCFIVVTEYFTRVAEYQEIIETIFVRILPMDCMVMVVM